MSTYGAFSGSNTGKYGPKKTPHLNTFQAVNARTLFKNLAAFAARVLKVCLVILGCMKALMHKSFKYKKINFGYDNNKDNKNIDWII